MAQSSISFPENAVSAPGFDRFDSIPTVRRLKERYLHGVDFKDGNGKDIKKTALEFYIKQAISMVEHELEITIVPTEYTEKHDYRAEEYEAWGFLQLRRKPVLNVSQVQFRVERDATFIEIPETWIRLQNHTGQLQIAPTSGGLSSINYGQNSFLPRIALMNTDWPEFFNIVYTAGFEYNKIPAVITHTIGLLAAIQALHIAGDIILGAGIANTSISIDGLSQSIGTTSSPSNAGYGARINQYLAELKIMTAVLRRYYGKSIKAVVV